MVCDRCIQVLTAAFAAEGFSVKKIHLGEAVIESKNETELAKADEILLAHGFHILADRKESLLALIHDKITEALAYEMQTGEHVKRQRNDWCRGAAID